jgi:hypothetical protein
MGKEFSAIDESVRKFIAQQKMFFVATAPLDDSGLINCSPKGLDSFAILDDHTVAYLDITGSGVETIAHLKENARICIMFCSFDKTANIIRLQGKGEVIEPHSPEFDNLIEKFPEYEATRAVIRVNVERISDSCGYGVPVYDYIGQRDTLIKYWEHDLSRIPAYWKDRNAKSLDGLTALEPK